MNDHNLHGPEITYVTDGDLDRESQERVIREFLACADIAPLRVAFRLPKWSSDDFMSLVEWYQNLVVNLGVKLESALVHDRPEATAAFADTFLWLPQRNVDLARGIDIGRLAVSVHSVRESHDAVFRGASELVFGNVFRSESHPGQPGKGLAEILSVVDAMQSYANPPRITAIGGIDEHTISEIGTARMASVMCMRAISRSANIPKTVDRIHLNWVAARIAVDLDDSQRAPFNRPSSLFF